MMHSVYKSGNDRGTTPSAEKRAKNYYPMLKIFDAQCVRYSNHALPVSFILHIVSKNYISRCFESGVFIRNRDELRLFYSLCVKRTTGGSRFEPIGVFKFVLVFLHVKDLI